MKKLLIAIAVVSSMLAAAAYLPLSNIDASEPDILVEFKGGRSNFEMLNGNVRAWADSGEAAEANGSAGDPIRVQIDAVEARKVRATVSFGDDVDPVELTHISHRAAAVLVKASPGSRNSDLTDKPSALAQPIPVLAGPRTADLGLHSIHSYGYAFRSSPAFICTCPSPASGIPVRNAGKRSGVFTSRPRRVYRSKSPA